VDFFLGSIPQLRNFFGLPDQTDPMEVVVARLYPFIAVWKGFTLQTTQPLFSMRLRQFFCAHTPPSTN
jgi:hypothetical protein